MVDRKDSLVPENAIKLVILGQGAVGKSNITLRFTNNDFQEEYNPTLQETFRKNLPIDDKPTTLEILDTAGMEEYEVMQETWINQGKGFLLVYSIDDDVTFQEIKKIKKRIDRIKNFEKVSAILLGNKADLEDNRKVTRQQGQDLANELGMLFLETSAKTGQNCQEAFIKLVRDIRSKETPTEKKKKDKGFFKKLVSNCNLI